MSVKITGMAAAKREFQELEEFLKSPRPMQGVVDDAKRGILEKTALGLDYRGRSFEPYSDAYAKKKKGMTATGRPNLKVSGTMLGAMKAEVITPSHGRVSIGPESDGKVSAEMLANIHNTGSGKQPQREFMALTENAKRVLLKKHIDDPLLEITRRYR